MQGAADPVQRRLRAVDVDPPQFPLRLGTVTGDECLCLRDVRLM